jgi:hypothetical protein
MSTDNLVFHRQLSGIKPNSLNRQPSHLAVHCAVLNKEEKEQEGEGEGEITVIGH